MLTDALAPDTPTQDIIDAHVIFHHEDQIMEVSFTGLTMTTSADVNQFYDRVEELIDATGEQFWFFLVNHAGEKIDPDAWFAFSRRGRDLNKAHSMGSVRYDASEATRRQIERDAGTANFDPNLFATRDQAIAKLRSLPSKRQVRQVETRSFNAAQIDRRIVLHPETEIMDLDLSNLSLEHATDVDTLYDAIEARLQATEQRWYFLINYQNTRIQSPAWVRFAARGKHLNETYSQGSVRYAPGSETETDIRLRAESRGFRPNIRNTREEALERIAEMRDGVSIV